MSWKKDIRNVIPVDALGVVFRIDLRWYGWKAKSWEQILSQYPYGLRYVEDDTARRISEATGCRAPYVRADWFAYAASRPPLYNVLLNLPETDRALERLLGVNVDQPSVTRPGTKVDVVRAGFNGSIVAWNNRLIERRSTPYDGAYWKSYDFSGSAGRRDLFDYPLNPEPDNGGFQHDGEEMVFSLPNGLNGYMIANAKGERLDEAPITIVRDTIRYGAVVNAISCFNCHQVGVMLDNPVPDQTNKKIVYKFDLNNQVRRNVEENPKAFSTAEREQILALYPPSDEVNDKLTEDAHRFIKAAKATGTDLEDPDSSIEEKKPIISLSNLYESELKLPQAAAELGLTLDQFVSKLDEDTEIVRILGPLKLDGGTVVVNGTSISFGEKTVKRDVFEDLFPKIIHQWGYGTFPIQKVEPLSHDELSSAQTFWIWFAVTAGALVLIVGFVFWNRRG